MLIIVFKPYNSLRYCSAWSNSEFKDKIPVLDQSRTLKLPSTTTHPPPQTFKVVPGKLGPQNFV